MYRSCHCHRSLQRHVASSTTALCARQKISLQGRKMYLTAILGVAYGPCLEPVSTGWTLMRHTFNFLIWCLGSNPAFQNLSSFICESFVMHFPYKATSACCILYVSMGFRVFQYFNLNGNPWGTFWHATLKTYLLVVSLLGFNFNG